MRTFNEREKNVIKELVGLNDTYYSSMIEFTTKYVFPFNTSEGLYFDFHNLNLYLLLPSEDRSDYSKVRKRVDSFYEYLSLIIHLAENRYITVFISPIPGYWDLYLTLGETFGQVDEEGKSGSKVSYPAEAPDYGYEGPKGYKDEEETHRSYELGKSLYTLSAKYFLNEVYVSEDLKDLVKNNFISKEESRFKKQLLVSWVAIGNCDNNSFS